MSDGKCQVQRALRGDAGKGGHRQLLLCGHRWKEGGKTPESLPLVPPPAWGMANLDSPSASSSTHHRGRGMLVRELETRNPWAWGSPTFSSSVLPGTWQWQQCTFWFPGPGVRPRDSFCPMGCERMWHDHFQMEAFDCSGGPLGILGILSLLRAPLHPQCTHSVAGTCIFVATSQDRFEHFVTAAERDLASQMKTI